MQNWIADSAAEMQAARLMTLHAAWVMDTQGARAARTDIALIKFYGAKVLHDVVDRALQLHGSLGLLDRPAARADVPVRPSRPHLRRPRRGAPPERRAAGPRRATSRPRTGFPANTCPRRRELSRERFRHLLESVTADD